MSKRSESPCDSNSDSSSGTTTGSTQLFIYTDFNTRAYTFKGKDNNASTLKSLESVVKPIRPTYQSNTLRSDWTLETIDSGCNNSFRKRKLALMAYSKPMVPQIKLNFVKHMFNALQSQFNTLKNMEMELPMDVNYGIPE
jgi:hypothetical protein